MCCWLQLTTKSAKLVSGDAHKRSETANEFAGVTLSFRTSDIFKPKKHVPCHHLPIGSSSCCPESRLSASRV